MPEISLDIIANNLAGGTIGDLVGQIGNLNVTDAAAVSTIAGIGGGIVEQMKAAYDATLQFNDEVLKMQAITGGTADASSRMVVFMEKLGISQTDATTAARKLAAEGYTLDINTLQLLADNFQKIQDPAEKQKFLLDNLGRSGFDYARMLSMTNEQMKAMYNDIPASLDLTQKQRDSAEDLNIQMATLNVNVLALKTSFGEQLIPELASFTGWLNTNFDSLKKWSDIILALGDPLVGIPKLFQGLRDLPTSPHDINAAGKGGNTSGIVSVPSAVTATPAPVITNVTVNVPFQYSPMVSTGSKAELGQTLSPIITDIVNKTLKDYGVLHSQ